VPARAGSAVVVDFAAPVRRLAYHGAEADVPPGRTRTRVANWGHFMIFVTAGNGWPRDPGLPVTDVQWSWPTPYIHQTRGIEPADRGRHSRSVAFHGGGAGRPGRGRARGRYRDDSLRNLFGEGRAMTGHGGPCGTGQARPGHRGRAPARKLAHDSRAAGHRQSSWPRGRNREKGPARHGSAVRVGQTIEPAEPAARGPHRATHGCRR